MPEPRETFDVVLTDMIKQIDPTDLSDETAKKIAVIEKFSHIRTPDPKPEPEPILEPVIPTTLWGKTQCFLGRVFDNETTRTVIKTGGTFAGVALVTYTTIRKDHVMERQALSQANQRNS